jgi:hypothetical protein
MEWFVVLFSRLSLLFVWIWTPLVTRAFQGGRLFPLLGLLFLPCTTLVFVFVYVPGSGVTTWGWLWLMLAFLTDLGAHTAPFRRAARMRSARTGLPA